MDVFITYEDYTQSNVSLKYNEAVAGQYLKYFKQMSDACLKKPELLRHTDIHIKIPVIDRLHLNCKLSLILDDFTSSKTCHTFYHIHSPISIRFVTGHKLPH